MSVTQRISVAIAPNDLRFVHDLAFVNENSCNIAARGTEFASAMLLTMRADACYNHLNKSAAEAAEKKHILGCAPG